MTTDLGVLWALHGLDEDIAARRATLARFPVQRRDLEHRIAAEQARLAALKERVAELQRKRRERERDIEAAGNEERKFQSQLPLVKKNEEYQALLHEIATVKAKRSDIETEVLVLLDGEDAVAKERPAVEQALTAAEREAGERKTAIDREEQLERERVAGLETERAGLVARLVPVTRARYERVHASRDGRAVVPILKSACGGCYRNQPPQVLLDARRGERLITCDGCGRLLVWPPEGS